MSVTNMRHTAMARSYIESIQYMRKNLATDFSHQQVLLLLRLYTVGEQTMTQLGDALKISPAAMSRHVAQLAKLSTKVTEYKGGGMVQLREDPSNRRFKVVTLAPKGVRFVRGLCELGYAHCLKHTDQLEKQA